MTFRTSMPPRVARAFLLLTLGGAVGLAALACGGEAAASNDTAALDARLAAASELPKSRLPARATSPDSASRPAAPAAAPLPPLSPLADSLSGVLVFAPRTQTWFIAAARGKRMLVDLGRVDADVRKSPERLAAYKEAVAGRAPVPVGSRFRLRGPWGREEVTLAAFDVWNGRIVGVVRGSPTLDSLARHRDPLAASAELLPPAPPADSAAAPTAPTSPAPPESVVDRCPRDSADPALAQRAILVRDSIESVLRQTAMPAYESLASGIAVRSSQAVGCFADGRRLALVVSLRSADNSWVQERLVLLDRAGNAAPVRVNDLRFKAHDLVYALDADGDGIDDLAARAVNDGAGATVLLRYDPKGKRFARLAGGFAWESR
ncbi:MAG: hypothetical protein ACJ79S_07470 [Gemmatimonadaceae bacterium]